MHLCHDWLVCAHHATPLPLNSLPLPLALPLPLPAAALLRLPCPGPCPCLLLRAFACPCSALLSALLLLPGEQCARVCVCWQCVVRGVCVRARGAPRLAWLFVVGGADTTLRHLAALGNEQQPDTT
jgi:hypothetical protein